MPTIKPPAHAIEALRQSVVEGQPVVLINPGERLPRHAEAGVAGGVITRGRGAPVDAPLFGGWILHDPIPRASDLGLMPSDIGINVRLHPTVCGDIELEDAQRYEVLGEAQVLPRGGARRGGSR